MDIQKIQGMRLQEARNIIGISQEKFSFWLMEHGLVGRYNERYSQKTIAAWESGRRNIPTSIKNVIAENVTFQGEKIQYAYLNGDTDFITKSNGAILKRTREILHAFNPTMSNNSSWKMATSEDIQNFTCNTLDKFYEIFYKELFPLYGYNQSEIFDQIRLLNIAFIEFKKVIEKYIQEENKGR